MSQTTLAGWKLVPIEPTLTMRSAANMEHNRHSGMDPLLPQSVYRAMLASAPVPPVDAASLAALNAQLLDAADNALNALIGCAMPAGGVDDQKTLLDAMAMLRAAIAAATEASAS